MNADLKEQTNLERLQASLGQLSWLVNDTFNHARAGSQMPLIQTRLDEIGDLLADCRGFYNSAKAENTTQPATSSTSGPGPGSSASDALKPMAVEPQIAAKVSSPADKPPKGGKT